MLSIWVTAALLALYKGQYTIYLIPGNSLSPSGYHLCTYNETRIVSFLVVHKVPYTESKPCGGWLLWKTCTVTLYMLMHQTQYKTVTEQVTRCCDGYEQVGRYCALRESVNRSAEFAAKPGSCPTADGLYPRSEDCELDIACPGWQKCCQGLSSSACQDPKHNLHSKPHTCSDSHLTRHMSADVDECAHSALRQCSLQAHCNNTVGSYQCVCHQGYTDVDPTPPSISSLLAANVTGTSFSVCWSTQSQTNQTHKVVLSKDSKVILSWETRQTMIEVKGLQPAMLYHVSVTPHACGSDGVTLHMSACFICQQQLYQSFSPEMRSMVDSGQVKIEIRGFSPGSVVVNFTIIFTPSQSQNISNVSTALLHSLMNISQYTVDENNTSINDFNECASLENDCSFWATCINIWASYMCVCQDGFTDNNPERPGRACQGRPTTPALTTSIFSTASTTPVSQLKPSTSDPTITTVITPAIATVIITSETVSTTISTSAQDTTISTTTNPTPAPTKPTTAPTITAIIPTTTPSIPTASSSPTTTTAHAIVNTAPTTTTSTPTISAPTTVTAPPTVVTTAPVTTISTLTATSTPVTTTTTPTTAFTTPVTTSASTTTAAPTTTTTAPAVTTTAPTTSINFTPTTSITLTTTSTTTAIVTALVMTTAATVPTTAQTTTTTPATTTITPTTITTTPTITLYNPTTTTTMPTTTTSAIPTATTTIPTNANTTSTTTTTTPTTTTTTPTTTTNTPTTTTTPRVANNGSMQGSLSVQCRVAAITVTMAKDFLLSSKIQESALYLGMRGCGVNGGNDTHVQLTVAWNECDTRLVDNITFTLENSNRSPESCSAVHILSSICRYDMIKDVIMGLGSFQVTVQLMNGSVPLPYNYSLSSEQAVVVEVRLNTSSEQLKVVINKCWATPSRSPCDNRPLPFKFHNINCSMNSYTKVLINGNSSTSRVSVQIFSIVNLNVIYLHCQVQICIQIGSDTCVPVSTFYSTKTTLSLAEYKRTRTVVGIFKEDIIIHDIVILSCRTVYKEQHVLRKLLEQHLTLLENFTYLVFNT
uniref:Uromodulin-like 1 n=1 Tax=Amphiprion percula TaxID=161767 RepID=A0A3P8TDX0_AMPPE